MKNFAYLKLERIIPACAGNMRLKLALIGNTGGSSPHVRVILAVRDTHIALLGIIPACAGNIIFLLLSLMYLQDHPSMCG